MSTGAGPAQQRPYDEIANLEEAFRYQEMELQKERENANNMQLQMMKVQEQSSKIKDKQDANKKKLKRISELIAQNKRQSSVLDQRTKDCTALKQEIHDL